MSLDVNGNLVIKGKLTQNGTPQTSGGPKTSSASQSRPTIENVGESRLSYGEAFVRMNSAWVHDVDFSQPYEVFVTPNASSAGVYVAERSSTGFTVRENSGGHSNVTFSYRIVAKTKQSPATNANTKGSKDPDNTMADRIIAKMRLGIQHYRHRQIPKLQAQ